MPHCIKTTTAHLERNFCRVYESNDKWLKNKTDDVYLRLLLVNQCYYGLQKQLRSSIVTRQVKVQLHKTLILPVLTYGSEINTIWKQNAFYLLLRWKEQEHFLGAHHSVTHSDASITAWQQLAMLSIRLLNIKCFSCGIQFQSWGKFAILTTGMYPPNLLYNIWR